MHSHQVQCLAESHPRQMIDVQHPSLIQLCWGVGWKCWKPCTLTWQKERVKRASKGYAMSPLSLLVFHCSFLFVFSNPKAVSSSKRFIPLFSLLFSSVHSLDRQPQFALKLKFQGIRRLHHLAIAKIREHDEKFDKGH